MRIYHQISRLIPESKFKNRLRSIFYNIIYSFTFGSEKILFDCESNLFGRFYKTPLIKDSDCMNALKGYVKSYKPKKGEIVVDAGAFHGHFAVYAAKLVGNEGKVICFEPERANFNLLKKNIRLNKLTNVTLIKKGLWDQEEVLKFKSKGPVSTLADFDEEKNLSAEIEVASLDSIMKKLRISKVNFIKMDIEGAEIMAIKGAEEIMKKNNIHFAVASYHKVNGEKSYKELEKLFRKKNYIVHTSHPSHLTTYAKKRII